MLFQKTKVSTKLFNKFNDPHLFRKISNSANEGSRKIGNFLTPGNMKTQEVEANKFANGLEKGIASKDTNKASYV
jgi:hypothetical protein